MSACPDCQARLEDCMCSGDPIYLDHLDQDAEDLMAVKELAQTVTAAVANNEPEISNLWYDAEGEEKIGIDVMGAVKQHENVQKDRYKLLKAVFDEALNRASNGKGAERHGNNDNFEDQPIISLAKNLGASIGVAAQTIGPLYQAGKKLPESLRLPPDRAVKELLDVINYVAAAVIILQGKNV